MRWTRGHKAVVWGAACIAAQLVFGTGFLLSLGLGPAGAVAGCLAVSSMAGIVRFLHRAGADRSSVHARGRQQRGDARGDR
jgi:hypothetical protein